MEKNTSNISLNQEKTKSGKTKYTIKVVCECGWKTSGSNTFSEEYLLNWGNGMAKWHNEKEHINIGEEG